MKADTLRQKFLDFFKGKKHKIAESDSLVPKDDPTVLFTPAGMNQFKKQFLGHLTGFSRAATSQRCLRTDDLDKVGKTPSHHTFFEMLGNFSFGDYFKEEAIAWAWEFLAGELKIAQDKLWVSVYRDDEEAYKAWKNKIVVPENKIIKLGDKENFWPSQAKERGPNGPCGPCSEVFFDQGDIVPGCGRPDCGPSCGCGRFVEVWNLVFTQFNRKADGKLEPLPKKNIDTGMGLERLAAVMQGVPNNFQTDLFQPIVKEIKAGARSEESVVNEELIHAIADHIRAVAFAIYDGVLPSNDGRGYVVRKLIRRSRMHLSALGIQKPFLFKLVPIVSQIMRVPYPELEQHRENISDIILEEEKNFISILKSSDKYLVETFTEPYNIGDPGNLASLIFRLTDTYGLPLEIIINWLEKHGGVPEGTLDLYNKKLEEQKQRSKALSSMKGDVFDIKDLHLLATKTGFLGYGKYEIRAKIIKIIKDNLPVKKITKGDEAKVILDRTVFYAESGGQIGDAGEFMKGKNIFQVTDTQKSDKVIVHTGIVKEGSFKTGDEIKSRVDMERRLSIARNHTATHLLQAALRKALGPHVQQQGSLVAFDRLRFDFTHFKDISQDELDRVEEIVNGYIIRNDALKTKLLILADAKKQGALAFFGEKYEGKVRMVSIGDFSKELCGGTHLDSTGSIGIFKITQEGSVASGVRRIEAVTGKFAYDKIKEDEGILSQTADALGVSPDKVIPEMEKRLSRLRELEKQLRTHKLESLEESIPILLKKSEVINNINVITAIQNYLDMDLLRKAVDMVKQQTSNSVIALASQDVSRALLVIGITADLLPKGWDASILIRGVAKTIGGSGGGRKDFAQAGGNMPQNLETAFQELKNIINNSR